MMFSRLTRRLVPTIVASATTKPIANDCARLCGSSVKKRSKRLCSVAKMRAETATSTRAEPDPDQRRRAPSPTSA